MIKWDELIVGNYYEITYESKAKFGKNVYTACAISNDELRFFTNNKEPFKVDGHAPMADSIRQISKEYALNPHLSQNSTNEQAVVLLHKDL